MCFSGFAYIGIARLFNFYPFGQKQQQQQSSQIQTIQISSEEKWKYLEKLGQKENKDKNPSQLILSGFCPDMSDIEVDIRTDENVHGVTDPSAAGPATQSRYNRYLLRPTIHNKFSVWGHLGCPDRNKFNKI